MLKMSLQKNVQKTCIRKLFWPYDEPSNLSKNTHTCAKHVSECHQCSSLHKPQRLLERSRKACSPAKVVVCALSTGYGHARTGSQDEIIGRRSWHGWRYVRRAPTNGSVLYRRTHRADKSWNGAVDCHDGGRRSAQVGHNVDLCVSIIVHLSTAKETFEITRC